MTCNNKCIHYPVCEQKNFEFANIEDCPHYLDLSKEIRTIKVPTYPDGEEYCIRCIPADVLNEYKKGGTEKLIDNAQTVEINDKSLEIARKSIEVGRKVGKLEDKLERPQGEWIEKQETPTSISYYCSNCEHIGLGFENFCAWCGAKMRGGAE